MDRQRDRKIYGSRRTSKQQKGMNRHEIKRNKSGMKTNIKRYKWIDKGQAMI